MLIDDFVEIFDVWEEARPYLSLMVDEQEMACIVKMKGRPMTPAEAAEAMQITLKESAALLERCYSRCIVDRITEGEVARYIPGNFEAVLDHFVKYGRWDDIPAQARSIIDRRFLDSFIARCRPGVERKQRGLEAENALPNDTIMLLSEIEEMIDAAAHIVVQPCDCRRLGQNCDRPVETCIWLDDEALEALDRGHGRRLTKAEARELIRWADKKGLMHTADSEWHTRGLHAICNCCACDCYPFRAARVLGSKGVWPMSRYVAVHDGDACSQCGVCIERCHFNAFFHTSDTVIVDGRVRQVVGFDPEKCWGCGLCANTCVPGAIEMVPLNKKEPTEHTENTENKENLEKNCLT
jgi:ferredoxin